MYLDNKGLFDGFVGPTGVDNVYCVYGTQVDTAYQLVYRPPTSSIPAFPEQKPQLIMGDGDGTVDLKSLQMCHSWPGVKVVRIPGGRHRELVGDSRLIDLIQQIARVKRV
ncbi:unnamed protein product [Echinostoma caproni]|uniref:Hydrolase_4 domain-containing protein n=1 Tax=Echinostoma caproni TaxID=27848 RepID=A0A183AL68_9TREM|nr:unnamed protein product [Echinostoma caproni]